MDYPGLREAEENLCKIREKEDSKAGKAPPTTTIDTELRCVRSSITNIEKQIQSIKEARGWIIKLPVGKRKLPNSAHANVWRDLVESGSLPGVPLHDNSIFNEISHGNNANGKRWGGGRGRGGHGRGVKRGREGVNSANHNNYSNSGFLQQGPGGGRGQKRSRQPSVKERRVDSIWAQCVTILNAIKKHRYSWPFLEPVDPVGLNIPDYFEVIKRPMDLGTVSKRLEHAPEKKIVRNYKDPLEFRDDVRLVWENCRAYNRPGQDVRLMGDFLSEMWEKKWCQSEIEEKWKVEEEGTWQLQSSLSSMNSFPSKRSKKGLLDSDRDLTFLEKRRLAQQVGALNGEQLAGIAELVIQSGGQETDEELELDFDKIESKVLWKLKQYVDKMGTKKRGKQPAKKGASTVTNGGEVLSSQLNGTPSMADTDDEQGSDMSLGLKGN